MNKTILGLDPGLSGGLAYYNGAELIVYAMPFFNVEVGGKSRKRIDVQKLKSILMDNVVDHAVIEKVNAQPGNGTAAAFAYGYGVGVIDAAIACCGIPFTHVTPQKWKKAMDCPADKDAARKRASELLPSFSHCWSRRMDDGIAEAALIALYGMRIMEKGN